LLSFVNHPRPAVAWTSWNAHCHLWHLADGPFTDETADEVQELFRIDLHALMNGEYIPSSLTLAVQWQPERDVHGRLVAVRQVLAELDLKRYFEWVLIELLREGRSHELRECERCRSIFLLAHQGRTLCSAACRRAQNTKYQRESRRRDREPRRLHGVTRKRVISSK
jgi:hypothetical protein